MLQTASYIYKPQNFIAIGWINDDKVIKKYEFIAAYTNQKEKIPRLFDVQKINRLQYHQIVE